jgi:CDP-glycerol glycerophosphotransferase (TagB/SpsB family)
MKIVKILFRLFFSLFLHVVYFLSGFFLRNKNVWVLGCWEGTPFRGNTKYFYQFVRSQRKDIECIWTTKNKSLLNELEKQSYLVCYAYSMKGVITHLRANFFFVTHGVSDVNQYLTKNALVIDFSHATYPIKKMGYASIKDHYFYPRNKFRKFYYLFSNPYGYFKPDYVTSSSEDTSLITQKIYAVPKDKILITGLPKSDKLMNMKNASKHNSPFHTYTKNLNNIRKILFLPTFRNDPKFNLFNFGYRAEDLYRLLEKINAVFFFNLHPFDMETVRKEGFKKSERIFFLNFKGDEINKLLVDTDVLITDYGSIWADFLLFDKPLIFANFDHSGYLKERELFVNYDDDLPGYKVDNWPALMTKIEKLVMQHEDEYQNRRIEWKEKIYQFTDGKSNERIIEFIETL